MRQHVSIDNEDEWNVIRSERGLNKMTLNQRPRRVDGSITVFLSLVLTCICALMGGLFESARTAGSGWYMQMALNSSLDSLMSKYHRDVWEQYRLFMLEYEDEAGLAEEMRPYLESYFIDAPFYPIEDRELTVSKPVSVTDEGGRYFEKEILDYMKFGIWNMEKEPSVLQELAEGIKEAESLSAIAEEYQANGRLLLKLEQVVEKIGESLERQQKYLEEGDRQLRNGNGRAFIRTAEKLKRELERIPGLVREYEEKADLLKAEVETANKRAEERRGDLQPHTWDLINGEMDSYRSYTDSEGSRRKEVKQTEGIAGENIEVIEEAIKMAEEIQEYIDSWESDDEDDELDEKRLWKRVLTVTGRFKTDTRFGKSGIKDKKKMNVLETLSRLAGSDMLSVVTPKDKKISSDKTDTSQFPSVTELAGHSGDNTGAGGNIVNTALIHEYAACFYTNFLSEEDRSMKYEQEYLIVGSGSDRENLKGTVNRLIAVREAMNLLYLLGDSGKRQEAEALALAITGASGIAPIVMVTTYFILTVWALAESIEDVKALLRGESVPFVKQEKDWKVSLSGLVESGTSYFSGLETSGGDENGFDYQSYLKLLFLLIERKEKDYRMMDMIQKNIRVIQSDFLVRKCAYRLEAEYRGRGTLIPVKKQVIKAY